MDDATRARLEQWATMLDQAGEVNDQAPGLAEALRAALAALDAQAARLAAVEQALRVLVNTAVAGLECMWDEYPNDPDTAALRHALDAARVLLEAPDAG